MVKAAKAKATADAPAGSAKVLAFSAIMEIQGINPYVPVSAARAEALKAGWRKPMPVLVRINGKPEKPWRINMMPMGDGGFYLYLHESVRKESGTGVGDKVKVEVRFDSGYKPGPAHPMPPWFREALSGDAAARKSWEALIPSRKKEILLQFHRLKSAEARARNLEKAMHVLSGNAGRFMVRDWKDGK
jgi:hypothetical protein